MRSTALGLDEVTPEVLRERGVAHKNVFVKVLARGEITRPVAVTAHAVSAAAEAAITAAGGSVTVLGLPYKSGRPPVKGNQFANR